jgi:tripartite-type tricarboxylate transporter receptor subunit TctC
MIFNRAIFGILIGLALSGAAAAQQFPSRAVRIVVPFPPGGGLDTLARPVAAALSQRWEHPVIVDNRPGASSILGADLVAKSPPDGYTLLYTTNPTIVANRFLFKSMPYDPDKSFAPISLLVQIDQMLVAHPSVPANDLKELVALARREPGKLAYGSYGSASAPHMIFEMLKKHEAFEVLHVPYKGVAPANAAIIVNEVQLTAGSSAVVGGMIEAKQVKPLAVAGKQRTPKYPDVPTTVELGYPYLQVTIWHAMFAPAGTPPAIVEKIGADLRAIFASPEFAQAHATSKGLEVVTSGPTELIAAIKEETVATVAMVAAAGIEPE